MPTTPIVEQNLENSYYWGDVQSVVDIDRTVMLDVVHFMLADKEHCQEGLPLQRPVPAPAAGD